MNKRRTDCKRGRLLYLLAGLCLLFSSCVQDQNRSNQKSLLLNPNRSSSYSKQKTRRVFERAARSLSYFKIIDFLHDRDVRYMPGAEKYNRVIQNVTDKKHKLSMVKSLLAHEDPVVRTLAAAHLFDRENPQLLPDLARLLDDQEKTLPQPRPLSLPPGHTPSLDEWPMIEQSVDDVMKSFLSFYGVPSPIHQKRFESYWKKRKHLDRCFGWLQAKLSRARNTDESISSKGFRVSRVFDEIKSLQPVYRELAMLGLLSHKKLLKMSKVRYVENHSFKQKLIEASRRLGYKRRKRLLLGEPVINDPDWKKWVRKNKKPVKRAKQFLLKYPGRIFSRMTADELLSVQKKQSGTDQELISSWWWIAASRLAPGRAGEMLRPIISVQSKPFSESFQKGERFLAAKALWKLRGEKSIDPIRTWFFKEHNDGVNAGGDFIEFLTRRFLPQDKRLLVRLIQDDRFHQIPWRVLQYFIIGLNRNLMKPVVSDEKIDPYSNVSQQPLERSEYRSAIQESIPRWKAE